MASTSATAVLLGLALSSPLTAQDAAPIEVTELALGAVLFHTPEPARGVLVGNSVLFETESGQVLIDTGIPDRADLLRGMIEARGDHTAQWVANTHPHLDHVGGNGAFALDGATEPETLIDRLGPDVIEAHRTVVRSATDVVFYLRSPNVLVLGDLYPGRGYPFLDLDSGASPRTRSSIERLPRSSIPCGGRDSSRRMSGPASFIAPPGPHSRNPAEDPDSRSLNHLPRSGSRSLATVDILESTSTIQRGACMATQDTCCSIVPYFKIHDGQNSAFRALCERFVETTSSEPGCLYYGFTFDGDEAHCREAYRDAEGLLAHLENVGSLIGEALEISELARLEVHGPDEELQKLREPLAELDPQFFALEYGFRR